MMDWLRRVDPAFYGKEPHLLRTEAQVARYTDDAQAEVRAEVLRSDRLLHAATIVFAVAADLAVTGAGAVGARGGWITVWAFAVLAVASARALPWAAPDRGAVPWAYALLGAALVAIPALWTHADLAVFVTALLAGAMLAVARGRARAVLPVVAAGVLVAERMPAYPPVLLRVAAAVLVAGAAVVIVRLVTPVWRAHPQVLTWSGLAALVVACAYAVAFEAPALALHVPFEIAAIAVAFLAICAVAGRLRRAELAARPDGVLTLPQSIVPLLDRSYHHAVICRLE